MAYVPLADQDHEMEMHHPHSFVEKYVWSQDHKVIAIQYGGLAVFTGIVGLVLSLLFRMQLGFPDTATFIDPNFYYQAVTMHGMIMVVYLLTALFLGGFGNYMIPLMCGARDMVFPFLNMLSVWVFLLSVIILMASFFVSGGPTGGGWTLYPPQTPQLLSLFVVTVISRSTPKSSGIALLRLPKCPRPVRRKGA